MNTSHADTNRSGAPGRATLLCLLGLAMLAPDSRAETKDLHDLVRFRDEYKSPVVGPVLNYQFRPWRAKEKELVLKHLRAVRAKAPGVVERATACRPIQLYRVRNLGPMDLGAVPIDNAMLIPDGCIALLPIPIQGPGDPLTGTEMAELLRGEQALFHELVHLADPFFRAARDKEWVAIMKPRLDRLNKVFVRRTGHTIEQFYRDGRRDKSLENELITATTAEGLPSGYAASNLVESLAEITSSMLVVPGYVPPAEIKTYVRRSLLSTPYQPDPATAALHRAADFMARGELSAALRALDEVSEGDSSWAEACWLRSLVWEQKKDLGRAASALGPAVNRTAEFEWRFLYRRALLHIQAGAMDQAIDDLTAVLKYDPVFQEILTKRARCHLMKRDYDKAILDLDKAILLRPKSSTALGLRGVARAGQKDFARAIKDFDEAIWYDFSNHAALNGRARLRATCPAAQFRDGKAATLDAGRACELTGWKEPKYLDTLAAAHAESGDFKQAAQWQKKAIEQAPAASKAEYQARLALYDKGQPFREKG